MSISRSLKYTKLGWRVFEYMFKNKITISGVENLPADHPIIFVANHFTRFETVYMPYVLNEYTGRIISSLADKGLFKGKLGYYLDQTGTISTGDPERDKKILDHLTNFKNHVLYYPEGNMMKNKNVTFDGEQFILHLLDRDGVPLAVPMHKSAARHAINAQFAREGQTSVMMVPVNISYTNIRPKEIRLEHWAEKFIGKLSPRMREELRVEGNIISGSNIHIHICKPIDVAEFISNGNRLLKVLPVNAEKRQKLVVKRYSQSLITEAMRSVYEHVAINLDHIFALTLYHNQGDEILPKELIARMYLNIRAIENLKNYHLHDSIKEDMFWLFTDRGYTMLKSVSDLALSEGIITLPTGIKDAAEAFKNNRPLKINRAVFNDEHSFHDVRLKNVLITLVNEVKLLRGVINIVKKTAKQSPELMAEKTFEILRDDDEAKYLADRAKFKSEMPISEIYGRSFYLKGEGPNAKIGVVLSHGYKASPGEIMPLAKYLNGKGYTVLGVRLDGHGTAPENMLTTAWGKWYGSYMAGAATLSQVCDKLVFAGFSTGGLLSLYAAAENKDMCAADISINGAVKLNDIRMRFLPAFQHWYDLLQKFGGSENKFIDDLPEHPETNYARHYVKSLVELYKLMSGVSEVLHRVTAPSLIIQATHDPVVNPKSGSIIFNKLPGPIKDLQELDMDQHVIVRGKRSEEVFKLIDTFIKFRVFEKLTSQER